MRGEIAHPTCENQSIARQPQAREVLVWGVEMASGSGWGSKSTGWASASAMKAASAGRCGTCQGLEDPGNGAHGHLGLLHRFGIKAKRAASDRQSGPESIPTIAAEVAAIQVERLAIALLDAESCEDAFRLAELRIRASALDSRDSTSSSRAERADSATNYPRGIHRLLVASSLLWSVW